MTLDWDRACTTLARTLRSVLNQSDPDFYVGVCCHDVPDLPAEIGNRVNLVEADFPPPTVRSKYGDDKRRKKEQLAGILAEMGGGYFFGLDYDDLVCRDLVAYTREKGDANGYLIESGLVLDEKANKLARIPGAPGTWLGRPLHQVCGSCAILHLSRSELPGGELFRRNEGLFLRMREHGRYGVEAAAIGRPLHPIPFSALVYVLNTGNNVSYTESRNFEQQARIHSDISRNAISVSRDIAWQFGLSPPG